MLGSTHHMWKTVPLTNMIVMASSCNANVFYLNIIILLGDHIFARRTHTFCCIFNTTYEDALNEMAWNLCDRNSGGAVVPSSEYKFVKYI